MIHVLSIALNREKTIKLFCQYDYCSNLKKMTIQELVRKLKFILGMCGLHTMMYMFNRGIFHDEKEVIRIVGNLIERRGLLNSPRCYHLMVQYRSIIGKCEN